MSHGLPTWLRRVAPKSPALKKIGPLLADLGIATICQSARCPNIGQCWSSGHATFLILGQRCTRNCRFCAVEHGDPLPPDPQEPERIAAAANALALKHVVITSVTRDDLPDGGASHFAAAIGALRRLIPDAAVEVLVPDFQGDERAITVVLEASPDIFGHNVETVPRLYPLVRPAAGYDRSLLVLRIAKEISPGQTTKSGLMVGLGETSGEVEQVLRDLRAAKVDMVTIGQYLRPTPDQLPVQEYVNPGVFARYAHLAREMGFASVQSGPLVRSSYRAREMASGRSSSNRDEQSLPRAVP